jgi:quaternary ammonium compound-resistance protein SugE
MSWVYLVLAGLLEIGFTTALKMSNGFSFERPKYILVFGAFALASFFLLNLAMRTISLGTAYAVWTGIGAAGTAVVGVLFFGEITNIPQIFFLCLLIASIIGLKLVS